MTYQLPLFPVDAPDSLEETPDPLTLLRKGAALVLSVSGGKDSDAMTHHLLDLRRSERWTGDVVMLHADLGRAEWNQTPEYVENFARRKTFTLRTDASAPTKGRFVYDWLPIHDWTETDVWDCLQHHGDIAHPAYRLEQPNQRLSCALCVLASLNDLINGAVHNPDTYREYCRIEAVTGYSFRKDFWLSSLKPELLPQETLDAVREHQRKTG